MAGPTPAAASRSGSSTPASTTATRSSTRPASAIPAGFPKCDAANTAGGACKNVSPKVIVAKVFYNKNNQTSYDALPVADVGSHGTHVAGTVAGVIGKTAVVEGVAIDDMSGVAPGAWLGNYNVFPGTVEDARSEDILNAVEAAVKDGMDVLNLSLGGGYHGNNDLLAKGLDTAVAAGVVVVASAGNEGPGGFTIGSPGPGPRHHHGRRQRQPALRRPARSPTPAARPARRGRRLRLVAGRHVRDRRHGRHRLHRGRHHGHVDRQGRPDRPRHVHLQREGRVGQGEGRDRRHRHQQRRGRSDRDGPDRGLRRRHPRGHDLEERRRRPARLARHVGHRRRDFSEFITENGDIMAGFSSQGPTNVDYAIKPDLTSVGVNVLSSEACDTTGACGNDGDWAFYNGTSMSSPHVAGSAAVLRSSIRRWTPAQIKSALVNTADLVVKNAFDASTTVGPMLQGAGREDLSEADATDTTFWPISAPASAGSTPAGPARPRSRSRSRNLTGTARTFAVAEQQFTPGAGTLGALRRWHHQRRRQPDHDPDLDHGSGRWQRDADDHRQRRPGPRHHRPGLGTLTGGGDATRSPTGPRSPSSRSSSSSRTRSPGHRPGLRHVRCRAGPVRTTRRPSSVTIDPCRTRWS